MLRFGALQLVRAEEAITELGMDPTGNNSELRIVIEQQGEKIG